MSDTQFLKVLCCVAELTVHCISRMVKYEHMSQKVLVFLCLLSFCPEKESKCFAFELDNRPELYYSTGTVVL